MPETTSGRVTNMCVTISDVIATLTEIMETNGDMTLTFASDANEGLALGIGGFELNTCDCCDDDVLTMVTCSDEEDQEVTYEEYNIFKGLGMSPN